MDIAKEISKSLSERIVIAKVRDSYNLSVHAFIYYLFFLGRWRRLGP